MEIIIQLNVMMSILLKLTDMGPCNLRWELEEDTYGHLEHSLRFIQQ